MAYGNPPAYMGFVGFLRFQAGNVLLGGGSTAYNHDAMTVRATSADINVSQEVTKPDVIDSRYDRTVYQLGPKLVDGTIAFPAVYDQQGGANIVEALYRYAVTRADLDGLLSAFNLEVKYAINSDPNESNFIYRGCIANTFQFSVAQEDTVNISVGVIGIERQLATSETSALTNGNWSPPTADEISNTRIVTWNDARVEIREGVIRPGISIIDGDYVRTFECNINNNAERFYTLNKELFPQAIAPTKRDIDGSMEMMGRHKYLAELAWDNQRYCQEDTSIAFGFKPQVTLAACNSEFTVLLPNIVFEIEEMALTNDLFVTTLNWHCLPAAGTGIDDPLIANINTVNFKIDEVG